MKTAGQSKCEEWFDAIRKAPEAGRWAAPSERWSSQSPKNQFAKPQKARNLRLSSGESAGPSRGEGPAGAPRASARGAGPPPPA